jgi:hypothetical protein
MSRKPTEVKEVETVETESKRERLGQTEIDKARFALIEHKVGMIVSEESKRNMIVGSIEQIMKLSGRECVNMKTFLMTQLEMEV